MTCEHCNHYSDLELIRDCSELIDYYLVKLCQARSVGSKAAIAYMTHSATQKRNQSDILGVVSNHQMSIIEQIHSIRHCLIHSMPAMRLDDKSLEGNIMQLRQLIHGYDYETERRLVAEAVKGLVTGFRVMLLDTGDIPVKPWELVRPGVH